MIFNSLNFFTILSLIRTIKQDPGYISKVYYTYFSLALTTESKDEPISDHSLQDLFLKEIKDFNEEDVFFKFLYYTRDLSKLPNLKNRMHCIFCRSVRPERTHHCRKCKRCVLKMDHHCNILNTCIGYKNYKLYIQFLFYIIVTLLFSIITMIDGVKFYFTTYGWGNISCKVFTISFLILILLFVSIFELFCSHMVYISRGATTIEYEGYCGKINNSKTFYQNLREIFLDDNPVRWFWPYCDVFY
jgi:hypothetical protein